MGGHLATPGVYLAAVPRSLPARLGRLLCSAPIMMLLAQRAQRLGAVVIRTTSMINVYPHPCAATGVIRLVGGIERKGAMLVERPTTVTTGLDPRTSVAVACPYVRRESMPASRQWH